MRHHLLSHLVNAIETRFQGTPPWYTLSEPDHLAIELTNRCNYRCGMCPLTTSSYPKSEMSVSLFRDIIDQIAAWSPNRSSLVLHNFGEPFLHGRILEFIDYIDGKLPRCEISISTNFAVPDERKIERLFSPKPYRVHLGIWLDALTPETYSKQRGGDFDRVLRNLNSLISLKRRLDTEWPKFHIGIIITRNNRHEVESFKSTWTDRIAGLKGVELRTKESHDWAGQARGDSVLIRRSALSLRGVCAMPFRQLIVCSNGDVGLCCYDVDHRIVIGSAHHDSLRELWESARVASFREKMRSFSLDAFEPCCNCANYERSVLQLLRRTATAPKRYLRRLFRV